jgi:hypothetical protein
MGASLDDPLHLLEGTGKNLRHVKLSLIQDIQNPGILALVHAAMKERHAHVPTAA